MENSGAAAVIAYHAHYSNGFLPRAGGVDDQPAIVMDAIAVVAAVHSDYDRWRIEETKPRG